MRRCRSLLVIATLAGLTMPAQAQATATPPRGTAPEPRLAYIRDGNLWTVLLDGLDDLQITSSGKDADPTWEPGGTRIAFTRKTVTGPQIWIVDTVGGPPQRLLKRASDPTWALDGSAIAFVRRAKGNTDIWAADPDGSNVRRLTSSPAADIEPAWGPKKVAFVSTRGGRPSIWIMAIGGRRERRLTDGKGKDRSPAWVVTENPSGAVLHEHVDTDGDHDLRTVEVSDGTLSPILVRDEEDVTPAGAGLVWFAFVRRTISSSSIRTSDIDAPLTTMRILVSVSGLSDPAVPVVAS
jgi:dipeptidyl aminopeptidase/acylaminoacyl peptidase